MPIVEPEVLMDGPHTIERSYHVTARVLNAVYTELFDQRVDVAGTLLKPNMVLSGYDCPDARARTRSPSGRCAASCGTCRRACRGSCSSPAGSPRRRRPPT